jgi:predicted secreted protein
MLLCRNRLLFSTLLIVLLYTSLSLSVEAEALMWTQTYGGTGDDTASSLVITSDGGYALAGTTFSFGAGGNDFWLIKTDAFGNVEWNQTYGGTADDGASQLVVTSDGGYALAGTTNSFGAGGGDCWLIKIDQFGKMEWNQTYGGTADDGASQLVVTSDGGYALAGYTASSGAGGRDFWLVKTDMFGNMEWNQTYGGTNNEQAYSLVVTSDGSYALAGSWDLPSDTVPPGFVVPSDFWLVKTDVFGNMEWNQTYEGSVAYSLVDIHDGGFALAGETDLFGAGDRKSFLMRTDALGNVEWNQTYEGGVAISLVVTSDSDYALAGFAGSFEDANNDFWLVKTDALGNVEWNQTYDGTELDVASSLVEALDGGYSLLGSTRSIPGWSDFWLVKTDEFGVVPEAAWVVLPLLLVATVSIFISKKKLLFHRS